MGYKSGKLRRKVSPITIAVLSVIVVVLVGVTILLQPNKQRKIYNDFLNTELPKSGHVIEEIKYKKLIKKLENNENIIVFLGTPSDNTSRTEISQYNKEFEKQEVGDHFKKIYYLNVSKLKDSQIEALKEEYNLNVSSIPDLVYFSNNEIVYRKSKYIGDTNLKKIKDFYLDVIKHNEAQ